MVPCTFSYLKQNSKGIIWALLGKNNVCTNYSAEMATYTWECLKNLDGGTLLFTEPPMPIKCAGAPQKIAYLAADHLKKKGKLNDSHLEFLCAKPVIFGVPHFQGPLNEICDSYGIQRSFQHNLISIDGQAKEAVFKQSDKDGNSKEVTKKFDFIHVTPPQTSPSLLPSLPRLSVSGNEIETTLARSDLAIVYHPKIRIFEAMQMSRTLCVADAARGHDDVTSVANIEKC